MQKMYADASAKLVNITGAISDDQLTSATPCSEYDVRALLNHLFQVSYRMVDGVAGKEIDVTEETPDFVGQDDQWRSRFEQAARSVAETFGDPETQQGEPLLGIPREVAVYMPLIDQVIHAWDLARATGQSYSPDDDTVETLQGFAAGMAPQGREMGVFGAEVSVDDNDSNFAKLLGLTGRDPNWTKN